MNRHLFKKGSSFLLASLSMIIVSIVFFHSGIANAQQDDAYCHYVNGICYAKYPVYTPAPVTPVVDGNNNPINDQNCTATCITSTMLTGACGAGNSISGSWIQVPGKCTNPDSYCASCAGPAPTNSITPKSDDNGNTGGSSSTTSNSSTSTQSDRVEGKVTIQQDTTTPAVSPTRSISPTSDYNYVGTTCPQWAQYLHLCNSTTSTSSSQPYKGATITIDSNVTVTTDSLGEFEKSVPHLSTHTITLTVPEGYTLVSPSSATQTITNSYNLRSVNFTIKESEDSTTTTTPSLSCDPNKDGKQDPSDMTILKDEWFGDLSTKTADCNKDGVVNGLDFQILKDSINGVALQNVILNSQ